MSSRSILLFAVCSLFLAVALGAFGAHAMKSLVPATGLATWGTAVDYQFYHGLGLLGLGIWSKTVGGNRMVTIAAVSLILGMILFSGSLYVLVISNVSQLGMITPLGGLCWIVGWLLLFAVARPTSS